MVDLKSVREHANEFKQAIKNKGFNPDLVDEILVLDNERKMLLSDVEKLRAQKNLVSKEPSKDNRTRGLELKKHLEDKEPRLKRVESDLAELLYRIPNPAKPDVPLGENEKNNVILKTWGNPVKFSFPILDHLKIGEALDSIDVARAAKVSGSRFSYLKGDAVLLEFALVQFALDMLRQEGFIPVIPPVLVKRESMQGMGYLEYGEEDMFVVPKDDLILVGTSEQSIGPMHRDEVLLKKTLPLRYAGFSTCFRREAGSYGKDTRGILRVHQFDKVEMFSYTTPEDSDREHDFLLSLEERLLQSLKLPYQVVKMCTGDLGVPAARKYDIEVWIPSENKYREVTSTSTTTDFQARRLNIKYRDGKTIAYLHTLNGTAVAVGRIILAIFENNQQKDGSVLIPQILQPFMGKEVIRGE